MKKQTNVIEVKEPPQMINPIIVQGIRDKSAAEAWGIKNKYAVVYYIAKKQKVYAEQGKAEIKRFSDGQNSTSERLQAGVTACNTL